MRQTIYIVKREVDSDYSITEWENVRAFTIESKAKKYLAERSKNSSKEWEIDEILLER